MEIPDLVRQHLGDEDIDSAVNLGDEDLACFTPTRTLVYRSEGLISDESIEAFEHDVERLDVSRGRRKTKFTLEYYDRRESFSVPGDRAEPVLERLLGGVLGVAGVIDEEEDVAGVYRFSEMTVIVTDSRLVKHVGSYVWDEDYEEFPFADVTGLSFEQGSVATQIVLTVNGRPQRIKAPNDEAPIIQQTLTDVVLEYHDARTLDDLPEAPDAGSAGGAEDEASGDSSISSDIDLDDSITPLVGGSADAESGDSSESDVNSGSTTLEEGESGASSSTESTGSSDASNGDTAGGSGGDAAAAAGNGVDPAEFEALKEQVSTLSTAVQRQNKLLKQQHGTIQQLIDELQNR